MIELFLKQRDLPGEITELVDDNFWNLLLNENNNNNTPSACKYCNNNKTGQLNICHCILGKTRIS